MTLLTRVHSILLANAHSAVDEMEDPEKMVRQSVREMDQSIRNARQALVQAVASEKQLSAQLDQQRQQQERLMLSARNAVNAQRDELARNLLAQRVELEPSRIELEEAARCAGQACARLRANLNELIKQRAGALRRRDLLAVRQRAALARDSVSRTMASVSGTESPCETLSRMEDRVAQMEAQSLAQWEILSEQGPLLGAIGQAHELAVQAEVDLALAELKAQAAAGPASQS